MKIMLLAISLLLTLSAEAFRAEFPTTPETELTPGSLCDSPREFRYPERIAYCGRDVEGYVKEEVLQEYREAGYELPGHKRSQFKIDHFIPLCAGGSNHKNNLWPQHRSVYRLTDELEMEGCLKLQQGKITQESLVALIKSAKRELSKVPAVLRQLKSL